MKFRLLPRVGISVGTPLPPFRLLLASMLLATSLSAKLPDWTIVPTEELKDDRLLEPDPATSSNAKRSDWPSIPTDELTDDKRILNPDAAVEIMDWKITIGTTREEYIRYKIYEPEKAEEVVRRRWRVSEQMPDLKLRARLTLPNGTTKEFGPESMKEQSIARGGQKGYFAWTEDTAYDLKEKFLLISGVERGAILEYRVANSETQWTHGLLLVPLQQEEIAIRHVQLTLIGFSRLIVLHRLGGKMEDSKERNKGVFSASNIPPLYEEPYPGPLSERIMIAIAVQSSVADLTGFGEPGGIWERLAAIQQSADVGAVVVTNYLTRLATTITKGARNPAEKAAAIHRFVRDLYVKYQARPEPKNPQETMSLHEVLEFEKARNLKVYPRQFRALALTLDTAIGLDAHTISLPDRELMIFDPSIALPALLDTAAIAIKVDGKWLFSCPVHEAPLPFGFLPWPQEGQVGLIRPDGKANFIKVPPTPSEKSRVSTSGKFSVDLGGNLSGECRRTYTGHAAIALRGELREVDAERRWSIARDKFGFDRRVIELTDIVVNGADDPDSPVTVSAKVRWPGYAARTKERLVLRPSVFRAYSNSPFPASERHNPVSFPYCWQELDELTITLPEGFAPESPTMPPPHEGDALSQRIEFAYDERHRTLHVKRTFKSELLDVPVKYYQPLKEWYDNATRGDHHEVVFRGSNVPMPSAVANDAVPASDAREHAESEEAAEPGSRSSRRGDN